MDLKHNIDKTDTLKNDLKLARNKINDKIISGGGGTIANTISDVPSAIDKMLKENYKKIAIINRSDSFSLDAERWKTFNVTGLNLPFTPQRIFILFHQSKEKKQTILDSTIHINQSSTSDGYSVKGYISNLKETSFSLNFYLDMGRATVTLKQIIAIE